MKSNRQLQMARLKQGISTIQLGYRLGLNQSTIVRLEQSEAKKTISLNTLEKVAQALGCRLEYSLVDEMVEPQSGQSAKGTRERTPSKLSKQLRRDVTDFSKNLSVAEKITLSCQLSDLALKLRHA